MKLIGLYLSLALLANPATALSQNPPNGFLTAASVDDRTHTATSTRPGREALEALLLDVFELAEDQGIALQDQAAQLDLLKLDIARTASIAQDLALLPPCAESLGFNELVMIVMGIVALGAGVAAGYGFGAL